MIAVRILYGLMGGLALGVACAALLFLFADKSSKDFSIKDSQVEALLLGYMIFLMMSCLLIAAGVNREIESYWLQLVVFFVVPVLGWLVLRHSIKKVRDFIESVLDE